MITNRTCRHAAPSAPLRDTPPDGSVPPIALDRNDVVPIGQRLCPFRPERGRRARVRLGEVSDPDQALHRRLDEQPSVRPVRRPPPSPNGLGSRSARTRPTALTVTDLAELQRIAGNAAVTTLVRPVDPAPLSSLQRASVAKGEGAQTWVRPGDAGPDVTKAQQRLNAIGAPGTRAAKSVVDALLPRSRGAHRAEAERRHDRPAPDAK